MGLLSQMNAAPSGTTTPPTPPSTPAGLTAKDAKAGQRYKVAGKVGTFQAIAGDRAFFTDTANAPFVASVTDPIEVDNPAPSAPAGLTAGSALQGKNYLVQNTAAVFVCLSNGRASFFPLAGGSPLLVDLTVPIIPIDSTATPSPTTPAATSNAPAAVLSPDAPASDPAKATATAQEADEDEEEVEEVAAAGTPTTETDKPKGKPGRKPKAPAEGALVLVIDGVAIGGGTDLSGYVNEIAGKMATAAGAKDVRLADPQGPLGFGKWRAALAEAAKANPPKGLCYVSRGELSDAVIEGLASVASIVVRPVR